MAVVVAFGCVGYRPQKAYASAILVGEAVDVLFGLLGSAGVVVGFEQTFEMRQEKTIEFFESMSATQQEAFWDWYEAGEFVTSDTGHRVFEPAVGVDSSFYRNFWQSVTDFTSTFISYAPPADGYTRYSLEADGSANIPFSLLGSSSDTPFFYVTDLSGSTVFVLLDTGYFVQYRVWNSGAKGDYSIDFVGTDAKYKMGLTSKVMTGPYRIFGIFDFGFSDVAGSVNYTKNIAVDTSDLDRGVAWGNSDGSFCIGNPDFTALNFYNGIAATNELIDCDTWVNRWEDALESDKQVGIRVGQDLSGYNTLDDIYNPDTGIVTGLDGVVNPGIPVTPDLTGISGVLQNIWSLLKGLATAIGVAVVGTGTLDFSAFDGIKLAGLFPFCIPFDLINSFKVFNVSPRDPVWTVEFSKTPMVGMPDFVIDMREYAWLFSIAKFFVYTFFVIGLIRITRSIIKG